MAACRVNWSLISAEPQRRSRGEGSTLPGTATRIGRKVEEFGSFFCTTARNDRNKRAAALPQLTAHPEPTLHAMPKDSSKLGNGSWCVCPQPKSGSRMRRENSAPSQLGRDPLNSPCHRRPPPPRQKRSGARKQHLLWAWRGPCLLVPGTAGDLCAPKHRLGRGRLPDADARWSHPPGYAA
jgi:hypothetical protein